MSDAKRQLLLMVLRGGWNFYPIAYVIFHDRDQCGDEEKLGIIYPVIPIKRMATDSFVFVRGTCIFDSDLVLS